MEVLLLVVVLLKVVRLLLCVTCDSIIVIHGTSLGAAKGAEGTEKRLNAPAGGDFMCMVLALS